MVEHNTFNVGVTSSSLVGVTTHILKYYTVCFAVYFAHNVVRCETHNIHFIGYVLCGYDNTLCCETRSISLCFGGEIGKHEGLKIPWTEIVLTGSIPVRSTNSLNA